MRYQNYDEQKRPKMPGRLVVDKIQQIQSKLDEMVETRIDLEAALNGAFGNAIIETVDGQRLKFSNKFICEYDGTPYEEPQPRLFSFNSPFGACPTCRGFGRTITIDYDLAIPDRKFCSTRADRSH